jgi:hypothetical protein
MKKAIFAGAVALLLAACEGPRGPEGPMGPPGDEFLGQIFEIDEVYFDYDSDLSYWLANIAVPSGIMVYESDAILAYRYVDSVSNGDNEVADVWEMLPNVYFLDGRDMIQYVFNHTYFDVELIIDGNHDLRDLDPGFTDDQSFRFVVVPAGFVTQSGVDLTDYDAVVGSLRIVDREHRL